jgi:hypothetical protein
LILYTALVLRLKSSISKGRLEDDRVFSYRTEETPHNRLYKDSPSWKDFRAALRKRVEQNPSAALGVTDIADFYPRIYQHRLINALQVAAPAQRDAIRVLDKMLSRLSEGTSYGIPVGPAASYLLGEAVLIDVDSTLLSYGIDFMRFVDDFALFGANPQEAEYGLRVLAETLFRNHGLTLQTAKTKVLTSSEALERHFGLPSEKEENRRELMEILGSDYDTNTYDDLSDDLKEEIDAFNLSQMLQEALQEGESVDYTEVSFILGRLSALQKPDLIPIVIANLERLYPVGAAVASFFKGFSTLKDPIRSEVGEALLAPLLDPENSRPSEYYCLWVLNIFEHQKDWDHADDLLRVFRESPSDTIRRFAALALASSGTRSQALALKEYLATGSPLTRTAILLATSNLGKDERKYFRTSLKLSDPLEKLCAQSSL